MTQEPTFRCPKCGQGFYQTVDAARYLNTLLTTFRHHVQAGNVEAFFKLNRRWALFTPDDLNRFQASRRGPGRPRKKKGGEEDA